jgi:hypothetical protein
MLVAASPLVASAPCSEEPDCLAWLRTIDFNQAPKRTFYADANNPRAADENPGTAELPWKTIQRGVRDLDPGDALLIKGGTYRESIALSRSGDSQGEDRDRRGFRRGSGRLWGACP